MRCSGGPGPCFPAPSSSRKTVPLTAGSGDSLRFTSCASSDMRRAGGSSEELRFTRGAGPNMLVPHTPAASILCARCASTDVYRLDRWKNCGNEVSLIEARAAYLPFYNERFRVFSTQGHFRAETEMHRGAEELAAIRAPGVMPLFRIQFEIEGPPTIRAYGFHNFPLFPALAGNCEVSTRTSQGTVQPLGLENAAVHTARYPL